MWRKVQTVDFLILLGLRILISLCYQLNDNFFPELWGINDPNKRSHMRSSSYSATIIHISANQHFNFARPWYVCRSLFSADQQWLCIKACGRKWSVNRWLLSLWSLVPRPLGVGPLTPPRPRHTARQLGPLKPLVNQPSPKHSSTATTATTDWLTDWLLVLVNACTTVSIAQLVKFSLTFAVCLVLGDFWLDSDFLVLVLISLFRLLSCVI